MTDNDPFDWTVAQLIRETSEKAAFLYESLGIKACLVLDHLHQALQRNDVDGEAFLGLTNERLKTELNILSWGQRIEVMKIVNKLQKDSAKYQHSLSEPSIETHDSTGFAVGQEASKSKPRRVEPQFIRPLPTETNRATRTPGNDWSEPGYQAYKEYFQERWGDEEVEFSSDDESTSDCTHENGREEPESIGQESGTIFSPSTAAHLIHNHIKCKTSEWLKAKGYAVYREEVKSYKLQQEGGTSERYLGHYNEDCRQRQNYLDKLCEAILNMDNDNVRIVLESLDNTIKNLANATLRLQACQGKTFDEILEEAKMEQGVEILPETSEHDLEEDQVLLSEEDEEYSDADTNEDNYEEHSSHQFDDSESIPPERRESGGEIIEIIDDAGEAVAPKKVNGECLNDCGYSALISRSAGSQLFITESAPYIPLDPYFAKRIKKHQLEGVRFLWKTLILDSRQAGGLLAHAMGLGKSAQVIMFLTTLVQMIKQGDPAILMNIPERLRTLKYVILCPAAVTQNWKAELIKWEIPGERRVLPKTFMCINDKKSEVMHQWSRAVEGVLVISYHSLGSKSIQEHKEILKQQPSIVVADEAQMIKNPDAGYSNFARMFETRSRIALSGTPVNNNIKDFWSMMDFVHPDLLGDYRTFHSKYGQAIERGMDKEASKRDKLAADRMLLEVRRLTDDKIHRRDITVIAKELTVKREFFIDVAVTGVQRELYKKIVAYLLTKLEREEIPAQFPPLAFYLWINLLDRLLSHPSCLLAQDNDASRQSYPLSKDDDEEIIDLTEDEVIDLTEDEIIDLTEDPVLTRNINSGRTTFEPLQPVFAKVLAEVQDLEDPSLCARTQAVTSLVKKFVAQKEKVLLFSHSIPALEYLSRTLTKATGQKSALLTGKTTPENRQCMSKQCNDDKDHTTMVFLLSTSAGGVGLNFYGASRVIIYDFHWNPALEEQACGRAYRIGQTRDVYVYRFRASGTFEEEIHLSSVFKRQLSATLVDRMALKGKGNKYVEKYIFYPRENPQQDLSACKGQDSVLDKVIAENPEWIVGVTPFDSYMKKVGSEAVQKILPAKRPFAKTV